MLKAALPVVILATLLACGKDRAPAAPASKIQVLTAGAGPGQLLRYQLTEGMVQRHVLVLEVDLQVDGMGGPLPGLALLNELTVGAVRPDGSAAIQTRIIDVTARDRPGSAIPATTMAAQTSMMRGLVLTATLSPDGLVTGTAIDAGGRPLPPGLASQLDTLARSLEQISLPLPATPVGVGATWLYKAPVDQGGIVMTTATTVQLVAIDHGRIEFTTTTSASGADQAVTQAGTTLRVTGIEGSGGGGGTVDLAKLSMIGELSAELRANMTADGKASQMGMKIVTRFHPDGAELVPSAPDAANGEAPADAASSTPDAAAPDDAKP